MVARARAGRHGSSFRWRWYALFDRVAEPDHEAEKEDVGPLKVRALLHCKLRYDEGLLAVAHALPRYEARDEHDEFRTDC